MRDKTEAARVLLEHGWTFEEVAAVLGDEGASQPAQVRIVPPPQPYPYGTPVVPRIPSTVPDRWWNPWDNWSTLTVNGVPALTT